MELDNRNKLLLNLLQSNSRESLTKLAKALKLSLDSTHKRIKKLQEKGIISRFGIFIDPKALGYDLVANVQIKLHNISEEQLNKFIAYLQTHKNIIELITTLGDYDFTCVLIAKNTEELEVLSRQIRQRFKELISDWKSVINLKVHKFEEYSL
ncbi:MAG: Lrp/AsnC family transcriptional regulator [Candidatus Aenigmarchaeota archaeon]|nr:Lrp/AsnC family transcriptional regulator [Candidatus Aenigmarchaeota archaeon]